MKRTSWVLFILAVCLSGSLMACQAPRQSMVEQEKSSKTSPQKEGKVKLYLVRHGKTMFNTVHRAQGWADTPLTAEGVAVAKQLGTALADEEVVFKAAYSSDSGRARETTRLVLDAGKQKELKFQESTHLREVCFGSYEGRLDEELWGDVAQKLGYQDMEDVLNNYDKIGLEKSVNTIAALDELQQAETFQQVQERMQKEITKIAKKTAQAGGGNVLVVAHGMSIMALIDNLTTAKKPMQLANASVTHLTYEQGSFTVGTMGDTHYVTKAE